MVAVVPGTICSRVCSVMPYGLHAISGILYIPNKSCAAKVVRAVCMATSSALVMVRVSFVPAVSI